MPARSLGFTLIELMITIVILGVALAIAVPDLMRFVNQSRVKGVAENFAQDLVFARTEAVRLGKPVRLNVASTCYGITSENTPCDCTKTNPSDTLFCKLKRDGDWRNITLNRGTHFDGIVFDGIRGLPNDSSMAILTGTQTAEISQNDIGAVNVSMSVTGSVCISSPASKKIAGYPNAC
ncbi:GspH/FimT family pseudopilin [Deefgea tanakiae]|uniref:Type II secretion system protein H n=1 Tax=Deefgea tanakiae TaxID=2865840 RepID=A0ABX8Z1K8_9NEIS|nr:GspH/FimT family pseudopilin [Deefgea tanakiae]QZA76447.1 GspH/FimT family pseudopilin [Deefgea tanakiae]